MLLVTVVLTCKVTKAARSDGHLQHGDLQYREAQVNAAKVEALKCCHTLMYLQMHQTSVSGDARLSEVAGHTTLWYSNLCSILLRKDKPSTIPVSASCDASTRFFTAVARNVLDSESARTLHSTAAPTCSQLFLTSSGRP